MKKYEIEIIDIRNFWLNKDLKDVVASIKKKIYNGILLVVKLLIWG